MNKSWIFQGRIIEYFNLDLLKGDRLLTSLEVYKSSKYVYIIYVTISF